jgi:hypothetical protein
MKSIVRTFTSDDGKQRLDIFDNGNGFYSFEESCEEVEDIPDFGLHNYQRIVWESGLYQRLEEAERAAIGNTPWLNRQDPPSGIEGDNPANPAGPE